ncbi:MAG: carboxypeptidase-like regulatory domain-containing protein [bacterium]|nr:MAG: carboxypeptidase-like regulatory domain-containing protein [bacterium]
MTLKQFFQVAGGVIISLIFYSTPLHPIIKWPIIFLSAGLGAAMAFLPFEERPLERWIIAFFRSIYSPTLFTWKKTDKPLSFYTETAVAPPVQSITSASPTTTEQNTTKFEELEKSFLQKISGLFSISGQPPPTSPAQPSVVPSNTPITTTAPTPKVDLGNIPAPVNQSPNPSLSVPQQIPTVVTRSAPKLVVEETPSRQASGAQAQITSIEGQKIEEKTITSDIAEFSVDAAPPSPPIAINTIVGQVMDQDRKIVEGAILEIKDSTGRPVRALKSNKAGHFIIVTSLANGRYEVTVEKTGFNFEPVSFEAKGEMIPAIAIRGTKI